MNEDPRISRFQQMVEADPENELGQFSLGKAYLEAGRFQEAVTPLSRAVELNPRMSKAYQLLGDALHKTSRQEEAIDVVTRGVTVADEQGDRMPRDAMAEMLSQWGAPVPAFKEAVRLRPAEATAGAATPGFQCSRCGRPGGHLNKQPFKGPLGEKILENVCTTCWQEWIAMGTKVINELGLVLSTPDGQQTYDQYMIEYLQLEDR